MNREPRYRNSGMLFFLVLVLILLLSQEGQALVESFLAQPGVSQLVVALLTLGVALFTSDSIGYLFNAIAFFFIFGIKGGKHPEQGGYAAEWSKLSLDFRSQLLKRYSGQQETPRMGRWRGYSSDVFLSYFWQQAPLPLVQWVSRRHTQFFAGVTVIFAMVLALLLAAILIIVNGLGWTTGNIAVILASVIVILILGYNAAGARTEAWQLIDLWMLSGFDDEIKKAIVDIKGRFESNDINSLTPPFGVIRADDAIVRSTEKQKRSFYFRDDVDIVSVTMSKKHVEPAHLHTENSEAYYIIRGKLLLNVKGQEIWLNEGDLMVVNPGTCHHFETTEEEVYFLAIKQKPGLDDKVPCDHSA